MPAEGSGLTVGLLGTGRMGSAMAAPLSRAGHELVLWNRTPNRAASLVELVGGRLGRSPADVASSVDVLISMVADDAALTELYERPDGVLAGLTERTVAVDMSTVLPGTLRGLADRVRATGAGLLDAPVSGSVSLAEAGQLTIMVGGEPADLERARPALAAIGSRIFHLGPLGSGSTMKLAVNAVIFALDVALAEALVMAERAGVDRAAAYDVLQASAAGAPFVTYKRSAFLEPETSPTAFALDLAAKDLGLIARLAEAVGLPVAQVAVNLALIREAAASQGGARDFALVAEHLRAPTAPGAQNEGPEA